MQTELDAVKVKITAVGKAMQELQEAAQIAKNAIDANVAALGAQIAADTAISKP